MNMKILLSIKPEDIKKILDGEKRFEYRRCKIKDKSFRVVYMYATRPVSHVVGEFSVYNVIEDTPYWLWTRTKNLAGISEEGFKKYFEGCKIGTAIEICVPRLYTIQLTLKDVVGKSCIPPESFLYVNDREVSHA